MANKSIAVVGLWHLGAVYAASFAKLGFKVHGFDFDKKAVANWNKGIPPLFEPGLEELTKKHLNNDLHISSSEEVLREKDYIFITHDLPVDENDAVDTRIMQKTFSALARNGALRSTVVISSQVPIGTSRTLVNLMKKNGIADPKVIYFPENLRLGKAFDSFLSPDRIVLGSDSAETIETFKKDFSFPCPVFAMGLESAEMVKHALNTYLATCISWSSELSDLSEKTGANMNDVVRALKSDKRVSPFAPLDPGLGFAGGTLGRDVQSLRAIAKTLRYEAKFLKAIYEVNQSRLPMLLSKIHSVIPNLKNKTIGILGLTYKPNTDTLRRSMAVELAALLKKKGAHIQAYDPAIRKKTPLLASVQICGNFIDFFKDLDLVVLMTPWQEFRDISIEKFSPLMKQKVIIDTKNFLDAKRYAEDGFLYKGMGI